MNQIKKILFIICVSMCISFPVFSEKIYVMDNDPNGNELLVFDVLPNKKVRLTGNVPTGGLGAGDNAAADPLGGQGALMLSENRQNIYAVNAGSDEISIFHVNSQGKPKLIQVIDSDGIFPMSLTQDGDLIYVLNAGGDGTVAGFTRNKYGELEALNGSIRPLGLGEVGIPAGDARNLAPGQVAFDTLKRRLLVPYAGGGEQGQLLSIRINDEGVPFRQTRVTESEGAVPFSLDFSKNGTAIIAEAAGSLSSYNYVGNNRLRNISSAVINGEAATCWVQVGRNNFVFTTNTLSGTISTYKISRNGKLQLVDPIAAEGLDLPTDFALSRNGRFLSVIESGAGTLRSFLVNPNTGDLTDVGSTDGVPTFEGDGFAAQGIVIR